MFSIHHLWQTHWNAPGGACTLLLAVCVVGHSSLLQCVLLTSEVESAVNQIEELDHHLQ